MKNDLIETFERMGFLIMINIFSLKSPGTGNFNQLDVFFFYHCNKFSNQIKNNNSVENFKIKLDDKFHDALS